jgi:hypothetical protein
MEGLLLLEQILHYIYFNRENIFQKRVVRTKFDIYVFITIFIHYRIVILQRRHIIELFLINYWYQKEQISGGTNKSSQGQILTLWLLHQYSAYVYMLNCVYFTYLVSQITIHLLSVRRL